MFGTYPRLFAAYRVLRRLLAPRHPPYALNILALMLALAMEFPRYCESESTLLTDFDYVVLRAKKPRHPKLGGRADTSGGSVSYA